MPTSRKLKKKSVKKVIRKNPTERGIFSEKLLVIIGVILVLGVGLFIWQPWKNLSLPILSKPIAVTKPRPNLALARQMTIDPAKDTVMQIVDTEKVYMTLEIPKGALKEKTVIKMIPFYYEKSAKSPTAGVIISPATVHFSKPVTLSFNLTNSTLKNNAPENLKTLTLRSTGTSQVMQIDAEATTLTPTLVSRGVETARFVPARILTGGAYVYSLDGVNQKEIARRALDADTQNSLTIIEAATVLVYNDQKLSKKEMTKVSAALKKILTKKEPPASELFAALSLQKRLQGKKTSFSLIQKAHAETSSGYLEFMCKQRGQSVTDYLSFAQTAELMGHQSIADECKVAAKNIVAEEASDVLSNPDSDLKSIMIALQRVQIIGLDEDSNFDEALENRAKVVVTKEAQKVLADPEATAVDVAKALQKVEAIGAANDSVGPALDAKLQQYVDQEEARLIPPESYDENLEDLIPGFDMNVIGLAMAQALFGLESFDEEGLKAFADKMAAQAREMGVAGAAFCQMAAELGVSPPPECATIEAEAERAAQQIESEGYRGASEVGSIQDQDYEIEEYGGEEEGDDELDEASWMFYESLTPTPEDELEEDTDGEEVQEQDDNDGLEYGQEQEQEIEQPQSEEPEE